MTVIPSASSTVFVVDDDVFVREAVEDLIQAAGLEARVFATAQEFLTHPRPEGPCCLVLDVNLPGLNGLDLQDRIAGEGSMPIIFITGQGDVRMTVRAMKAGAVEFLTKPIDGDALLLAITGAIERSRNALSERKELVMLKTRYESLSRRERQVMALVVSGRLNKEVGGDLGISEVTVKAHRGRVMAKMKVGSFAELVMINSRLGLSAER